jgi:hypothetical protein
MPGKTMSLPSEYTNTSRLTFHSTRLTVSFTVCNGSAPRRYIIEIWLVSHLGSIRKLDSVYGSEYIHQTARSLYRCRLSCKDPFPSPLTQDDWVEEVWKEACCRTEVHAVTTLSNSSSLCRDEACLVFCHMWHGFTRIFRLNVTT